VCAMRKCKGKPSASWYGNGCRCAGCREAWRGHAIALRDDQRKVGSDKKKSTSRDKPIVYPDAFTREEILKERGMGHLI